MSKKAHTPTENETGPVVQERVERDRPSTILSPKKAASMKEPAVVVATVDPVPAPAAVPAKKVAKKKAAPKKRIRRTRAELIAAGYYTDATKPTVAPVKSPAPKKKAAKAPAAEVPGKRIRRTRAELIAAGYYTKAGKKAAHPPTKVPAPVAPATPEAAAEPKKRKRRGEWRKGRVWPVSTYTQTITVLTKKPKALAVAIRKTIWKFAVRTRKKAKKAA
jgi:hypothetical protein